MLPEMWWQIVVPVELFFPLVLWLSARCRLVFTSAAIFAISVTIVGAITFDLGHFGKAGPTTEARIWGTQAGILGLTLCALLLAAVFAERLLRRGRTVSTIVGQEPAVRAMWDDLAAAWGPARETRWRQPHMVADGPPLVDPDPLVRASGPEDLVALYPACVAMYPEELGVSPSLLAEAGTVRYNHPDPASGLV